jgi:hypothetical protein
MQVALLMSLAYFFYALYVFQGHERWKGVGVKKSVKLVRSTKKWNCGFRI